MMDRVANRLDLRPAAGLAWIQPVCISITERVKVTSKSSNVFVHNETCNIIQFGLEIGLNDKHRSSDQTPSLMRIYDAGMEF